MGEQYARFDPPDILWMKYRGIVSFEEAKWMVALCQELGSQRPLFVVADMTENSGYDTEGRRYASERMESEWFVCIIYVGARLIHKGAAKGIGLVQRLVGKKTTPLVFVSNEQEARTTLEQLKRSKELIPSQ
jgi:hypothetical protein